MNHKKWNIRRKLDGNWNDERKSWLLKMRTKRWNGRIILEKYLKIKVQIPMNFELTCLNERDFDDDELENLWEQEGVKIWDFLVKKCLLNVIFEKRKTRRYVSIFIKIMRKSWFWVKGYPFGSSKNSHRFFHNLKVNLIKIWKVKNRNIFIRKSQGKWYFFIQIMKDFLKKEWISKNEIEEKCEVWCEKFEKRFRIIQKSSTLFWKLMRKGNFWNFHRLFSWKVKVFRWKIM